MEPSAEFELLDFGAAAQKRAIYVCSVIHHYVLRCHSFYSGLKSLDAENGELLFLLLAQAETVQLLQQSKPFGSELARLQRSLVIPCQWVDSLVSWVNCVANSLDLM